MTKQEVFNQVEKKYGKVNGSFLVSANGVWLEDGVIEIDTVSAGCQEMFFKGITTDVTIPIIKAETDEAAEAKLEAKLKELFPEADTVMTNIM